VKVDIPGVVYAEMGIQDLGSFAQHFAIDRDTIDGMLEVPVWPLAFERILAEQEKGESMDAGGEEPAEEQQQENNQVENQRDVEVEDTPRTPESATGQRRH
jgi:hypothetical protein